MGMSRIDTCLPSGQCINLYVLDGEEIAQELAGKSYGLWEYYCDNPGCDCERAVINILELDQTKNIPKGPLLAAIHCTWSHKEGSEAASLEATTKPTPLASAALEAFQNELLSKKEYVQRLRTHYAWLKKYCQGQCMLNQEGLLSKVSSTGRNQSCPCGSGKKYKRCCMGKT